MLNEDQLAEKLFEIITAVGTAKSCFMEAIYAAKEGDFDKAQAKMKDGAEVFRDGHKAHASLIEEDANGNVKVTMLLVHAEDQLMAAETTRALAGEFIDLYKAIKK